MSNYSKWKTLLQAQNLWVADNENSKAWPAQFLLPTASSNYWHKWFGPPDKVTEDYLMYKTRKDKMYFLWEDVKGIKFLNND